VRAILLDKTDATNWALAWHQDRTIYVRERVEARAPGPWTTKSGMLHAAPPFDLLSRIVTLRVQLDDVPATNAPLLIAPGSHRHGRVLEGGRHGGGRGALRHLCLPRGGWRRLALRHADPARL
jgi:hypothetical protein